MTQPLPERPIDVSFQDALICIRDEARRFLRANPNTRLSREEVIEIMYESFLPAYEGHDPAKGPFLRRVRFLARHSITDYLRKEQNKIKPLQENENLQLVPQKSSFDIGAFRRSLSVDADKLLWVAQHLDVSCPTANMDQLLDLEKYAPLQRKAITEKKRDLLFKAMFDKGWTGDRIIAAYHEIVQTLADWYREQNR